MLDLLAPDVVRPLGYLSFADAADLMVLALVAFGIVLVDRCACYRICCLLAVLDCAYVPVIMPVIRVYSDEKCQFLLRNEFGISNIFDSFSVIGDRT